MIQSLGGYVTIHGLGGLDQTLAMGPAASQIAIKQLGTNGGGFFNVNSAFPFENPTQFSNFVEVIFILLIPAGADRALRPHGRQPPPGLGPLRDDGASSSSRCSGRLRRRAERLSRAARRRRAAPPSPTAPRAATWRARSSATGSPTAPLWADVTTDASNGSVNAAHDSYTGIGGLVPLTNMMTGEVIFGGVGSGLYGMLLTVLLAVFIAGLMVGRTPEYLGKKVESREMKLVLIGCCSRRWWR